MKNQVGFGPGKFGANPSLIGLHGGNNGIGSNVT
jgi:hypothetical protein